MQKKRWVGIFLSFFMMFSVLFQGMSISVYAEELSNVITGASITDTSGNTMTQPIGAWNAFRINVNYKLPNNVIHAGDTTTITLPAGIVAASPFSFELKAGNEVIATGQVIDSNPTKVLLTYTSYAENNSDIQGEFFFNAQIDNAVYTTAQQIPINLTVNGETVSAGTVDYKPGVASLQPIIKSGWMWSQDKTVGIYQIKVNQENKELINAKVTDTLLDSGVSYIPGTLEVFQGKWEMTPTGDDVKMNNPVTVTSQYTDKITYNGSSFTIDIGNLPAGTGLWFRYRVKLAYEPVPGEKFKNSATFTNDSEEYTYNSGYQIIDAGGSGEGYKFAIEINKTDSNGNPLKDATFDIIRVRSGESVDQVTTDINGYAKVEGLLNDDYLLREIASPAGYEKADDVDVLTTDFDPTTRTASKTVIDKLMTKSVKVSKKWIGKEGISATVHLYADDVDTGKSATLNAGNGWSYTFEGLRQFNQDGDEIEYKVKEDDIANYESKITGDMEDGYTIENTNTETITIPVTKTWVGKSVDKVEVKLIADGKATDKTITLNENSQWKGEFKDLAKYDKTDGHEIVYLIEEVKVDGYNSVTSGTAQTGFTITNTIAGKVSIPVTKTWVGKEGTSATIHLYADDTEVASTTLRADSNWQYTFINLEKYKDGKEIDYTIKEDTIENYKSEITGDMMTGFTVKNTNTEKIFVPVKKVWVGKATDKVEIKLLADNKETNKTLTLDESSNWQGEFKDLAKYDETDGHEIVYMIQEVKIDGYTTGMSGTAKDGFTITNTIDGKVSVPVTKTWVGTPTDSIIVNLYADGKKVDSQKLSKDNNWQYTFKDLEQYKDGKEITYTIEEEKVSGYSTTITGDAKNGYTITNTKDTPKIPNKPNTPPKKTTTPKTGDSFNVGSFVGLLILSSTLLIIIGLKRRKEKLAK